MGLSMGFHMNFYVKLFLIVTYVGYLFLITYSIIKINNRIKHVLSKNNLISVLNYSYNVFTVMEGLKSFLALFILTLVPILHLAGYFLIFAIVTEYTEGKLLTIIINREIIEFKKQIDKIKTTNLYILFLKNNYYKGFDCKVNSICNYFSHDYANNNLFIFYKFLALKNSFHDFYENIFESDRAIDTQITLSQYKEAIFQLEKDINLTYNLTKKYEHHFA